MVLEPILDSLQTPRGKCGSHFTFKRSPFLATTVFPERTMSDHVEPFLLL